jgi:hypothetical protein
MTEPTKKDSNVTEPAPTTETRLLTTKELEEFEKVLLSGPLAEATMKERRFLLGTSLISFASVKAGLMPTKITALGIESSRFNEDWFLFILGLVVLYFWIAVLLYGMSDGMLWWRVRRVLDKNEKILEDQAGKDVEREVRDAFWVGHDPELVQKVVERAKSVVTNKYLPFLERCNIPALYPISYSRVFFDLLFPLSFGLLVMLSVFWNLPASFWGRIF